LIILYILAAIVGVILLAVIFVLFCKISYSIYAAKAGLNEPFEYEMNISILSGIIKQKFGSNSEDTAKVPKLSGKKLSKKKPLKKIKNADALPAEDEVYPAAETKEKDNKDAKSKISSFQNIRKNLKDGEIGKIVKHSLTYIKKVFKVVMPKKFIARGRYGAEEPDRTGLVLAALWSVAGGLGMDIDIEGDFENEALEFEITAAGHLRLWFIALPTLKYITKREIRRILFAKRIKKRADKKKKKAKMKARKDVLNGHRI